MSQSIKQMEQPSAAERNLMIMTSFSFWEYLSQGSKRGGKHTRAEAFYDLLKRLRLAIITDSEEYLQVSYLELSKTWGWDRETVFRFLYNLQELGVISIQQNGNQKTLKFTSSIGYTTEEESN